MEGDVNARGQNCGETALQFDWLQLSFSLFSAFLDNLDAPLLDVLKGHLRREDSNVNFLHPEDVDHIGEAVGGV